jgi:tetratricopeptide (TPR) repeat protein
MPLYCGAVILSFFMLSSAALSHAGNKATAATPPKKGDTKKAVELYKKGAELGSNGKHREAMAQFIKATEADPTYAPAYNGWGLALANQNKDAAALEKYQKAVQLDPKLAKAYYNWGLTLSKMGKDDEAVVKLKTAARLAPLRASEINELITKIQKQRKAQKASPHRK